MEARADARLRIEDLNPRDLVAALDLEHSSVEFKTDKASNRILHVHFATLGRWDAGTLGRLTSNERTK